MDPLMSYPPHYVLTRRPDAGGPLGRARTGPEPTRRAPRYHFGRTGTRVMTMTGGPHRLYVSRWLSAAAAPMRTGQSGSTGIVNRGME